MSRRVLVAIVIGLLAASACGVPSQDSATKTDSSQVPFGLLDRNRGVVPGERSGDRDAVVFLTNDGRLTRAVRRLPPPVTLTSLLDALKEGPTRTEVAAGTRSAVLDDDTFGTVGDSGGTAVVELTRPLTGRSSADQVLALAQIVWTLTARPGIGQVLFTSGDQSIEIPTGDGRVVTTPVSRDDYSSIAPI